MPCTPPKARLPAPDTRPPLHILSHAPLGRLGGVIHEFLMARVHYGATDDETAQSLELEPQPVRSSRKRLVERGLVRDSGKKRRTRSGLLATVWIARGER